MTDRALHDWARAMNNGRCKPSCPDCTYSNTIARMPALIDINMTDVERDMEVAAGMERKQLQRDYDRLDNDHTRDKHQKVRDPGCRACQIAIASDKRDAAHWVTEAFAQIWGGAPIPKGFYRTPDAIDRFRSNMETDRKALRDTGHPQWP